MDDSSKPAPQIPPQPPLEPSVEPDLTPPQPANPQNTPLQQPTPTFTLPGSTSFSPQPPAEEQQNPADADEIVEPAPTDLSQLTENLNQNNTQNNAEIYTPPVNNTDTLIVSSQQPSTIPTTVAPEPKKALPIKLIIGAVLILFLVTGASAYFILGIGQSPPQKNSDQPAKTTQISTPKPQQTEPPLDETSADDSAEESSSSFGAINGTESSDSESATGGSSAIDILRERQQSQSSPSASPDQEE